MAANIVYWDSDAFLGLINEEPGKFEIALDVWNASEAGLLTIVTSSLTVAEVIYAKRAGKVAPEKRQIVNDFFRRPNLVIEPLTRKMAELARDVVWDHGIMPKDACHIATAAFHRIPFVHTFDGQLLTKATVMIDGFQVSIIKPSAPRQLDIINDQPAEDEKDGIKDQDGNAEPQVKPVEPEKASVVDLVKASAVVVQEPIGEPTTGAAATLNGSGAQTDVDNTPGPSA